MAGLRQWEISFNSKDERSIELSGHARLASGPGQSFVQSVSSVMRSARVPSDVPRVDDTMVGP